MHINFNEQWKQQVAEKKRKEEEELNKSIFYRVLKLLPDLRPAKDTEIVLDRTFDEEFIKLSAKNTFDNVFSEYNKQLTLGFNFREKSPEIAKQRAKEFFVKLLNVEMEILNDVLSGKISDENEITYRRFKLS